MNNNQSQNVNNGMNSIQIGNTVVTPIEPVVPGQSVAQATVVQPQVTQPQSVEQTPQVLSSSVQTQTTPVQTQVQQPQVVSQQQTATQASPVQSQSVQPQTVSPAESPFFTPVLVQPEVAVSPTLPEIAPVQPAPVEAVPTQVQAQASVTQEVSTEQHPQVDNNGIEVIETAPKSKASNIVLFIFLILLILFVFNIDTVISIYNQYKETKTISNPISKNTNNLTDGFILIGENTSSIRLKEIKFYNFRKSQGKGITFSYEALAKYEDPSSLEIYVELYNSEKEILYKELYNPKQKIEKDTVRTYVMNADEDIYADAFYALVKIYTDKEKQATSSLTCSLDDENYSYRNVYNFANNGLISYEVEKTLKNNINEETTDTIEDENQNNVDEKLSKEYEEVKDITNAIFENNTLKYTIDLNKDNGDYVELYDKDTTPTIIKNKEISKEWKCE